MGAMSAGGCFVTIDSSFPLKKIVDLVEDSKSRVILTTRSLSTRLKGLDDVPVFIVDDNYDTVFALLDNSGHTVETLEAKRLAAPRANLDNLAFIVYAEWYDRETKRNCESSSCPRSIVSVALDLSDSRDSDRVACNVFYLEAIRPILRGAATYCVSNEVIYNPMEVASFVNRHQITEMLFTPTLFQNVLSQIPP